MTTVIKEFISLSDVTSDLPLFLIVSRKSFQVASLLEDQN